MWRELLVEVLPVIEASIMEVDPQEDLGRREEEEAEADLQIRADFIPEIRRLVEMGDGNYYTVSLFSVFIFLRH